MDFDAITKWLTTTVPGLLILSTVGSVVAIIAWNCLSSLARRLPWIRTWFKRRQQRRRNQHAGVCVNLGLFQIPRQRH